jgi:hypothetical protein
MTDKRILLAPIDYHFVVTSICRWCALFLRCLQTFQEGATMAGNATGNWYALALAEYVARFNDAPPSILSEDSAMEMMLRALSRDEAIGPGEPAEQRQKRKSG